MEALLKYKDMPRGLTSYDLLKTLAIILMVVDHVGHFFYPEAIWFRVFGRMCVPIWFFLIGYAHSRDIPTFFWIAAGAVWVSQLTSGEYLFPANIVFSLIFARLCVDWFTIRALRNYEAFAGIFFFLFLLTVPTMIFFEYGTMGFLFAVFGALRRHKEALTIRPLALNGFIAGSAVAFVLMQSALLPTLTGAQFMVMGGGVLAVCALLYFFRAYEFSALNIKTFPPIALFQLTGRRTLEIYVLHLLVIRLIAMAQDPERFGFFDFKIFAFSQLVGIFV